MFTTINRLSITGQTLDTPQIFSPGMDERLAIFTIQTFLDADHPKHMHHYKVCVEAPLIVEYVDSFIYPGTLIYIEGRLEPMPYPTALDMSDQTFENWIAVDHNQGFLMLLHEKSQGSNEDLLACS